MYLWYTAISSIIRLTDFEQGDMFAHIRKFKRCTLRNHDVYYMGLNLFLFFSWDILKQNVNTRPTATTRPEEFTSWTSIPHSFAAVNNRLFEMFPGKCESRVRSWRHICSIFLVRVWIFFSVFKYYAFLPSTLSGIGPFKSPFRYWFYRSQIKYHFLKGLLKTPLEVVMMFRSRRIDFEAQIGK